MAPVVPGVAQRAARFENPTAPETIGHDLTVSFQSQSLTEESGVGEESIKTDRTRLFCHSLATHAERESVKYQPFTLSLGCSRLPRISHPLLFPRILGDQASQKTCHQLSKCICRMRCIYVISGVSDAEFRGRSSRTSSDLILECPGISFLMNKMKLKSANIPPTAWGEILILEFQGRPEWKAF